MRARREVSLFFLQRASALIMAPLVLIHLVVIIYAVKSGLSAEAILARTRGSFLWAAFYGLFVVAASVHAALGVRAILAEWGRWRGPMLELGVGSFALILFVLGMRAVVGVIL